MPFGEFRPEDYSQPPGENPADWTSRIRQACLALINAQGGMLRGVPGKEYLVGTDLVTDSYDNFPQFDSSVRGVEIVDLNLKINRTTLPIGTSHWFSVRDTGIVVRNCKHSGPTLEQATIADNLNGKHFIKAYGGCPYIVFEGACEINNVVSVLWVDTEGTTGRTRRIRFHCYTKNVTYPIELLGNGDDIELDLTTDDCHRWIVAGWDNTKGSKNVRGIVRVTNPKAHASIGAGCEDWDITYVERGSTASGWWPKTLVHWKGSTPYAMRNLRFHFDVEYGTSGQGGPALEIEKTTDGVSGDGSDRGHLLDGLEISGKIVGKPVDRLGNADAPAILMRADASWGQGDTWRRIRLHDLVVPDSWISWCPDPAKDVVVLENMTCPRGVRMHRSLNVSKHPRHGQYDVRSVTALNADRTRNAAGTQIQLGSTNATALNVLHDADDVVILGASQYDTLMTNEERTAAQTYHLPSAQPGAEVQFLRTKNFTVDISPVFSTTLNGTHSSGATTINCDHEVVGIGPGDRVVINGSEYIVDSITGQAAFKITAPLSGNASDNAPVVRTQTIRGLPSGQALTLATLGMHVTLRCAIAGTWEYTTNVGGTPTEVGIHGDLTDGYVLCVSTTYANARDGTGSLVAEPDTELVGVAGQLKVSDVSWYCFQSLLVFDTSAVPDGATISSALLSVVAEGTNTTDIIEAFVYDWGTGVDTGDFRSGTALGSLTKVAELAATTLTDGTRYTFTDIALAANINKSGMTRLLLAGKQQRTNTAPTGDHLLRHKSSNVTGTASDPRLILTYI